MRGWPSEHLPEGGQVSSTDSMMSLCTGSSMLSISTVGVRVRVRVMVRVRVSATFVAVGVTANGFRQADPNAN